jgi:RNA polymerase sigma factor (sigma-70 family)
MTEVEPPDIPSAVPEGAGFESFYRATVQRTFDLVRRSVAGDKHAASDITQDSYFEMFRRWDDRKLRALEDNARYVSGIAMNKVRDWYRRRGQFAELDAEYGSGMEDPALGEVLDDLGVLQGIRRLITDQSPRRRLVAIMFFLEDRKYDEIAQVLDMSQSTARTHVQRLRALLKPCVDHVTKLERGGERS